MKKISITLVCLLVVFLVAGCGKTVDKEQKLVCTSTENEDGMDIEQIISMTYKNDKLNHMTIEVNTKITDSTIQENWEMFKSSMDENNKEFDKDGVSLKVSTNDQNYEYNTTLDVDIENATKEALEEQDLEDLKDDNSTLESSKKAAEEDGAICEIR